MTQFLASFSIKSSLSFCFIVLFSVKEIDKHFPVFKCMNSNVYRGFQD